MIPFDFVFSNMSSFQKRKSQAMEKFHLLILIKREKSVNAILTMCSSYKAKFGCLNQSPSNELKPKPKHLETFSVRLLYQV